VPELPEVETVRAGLARWIPGRTIAAVEVGSPRSVRRHLGGAHDLAARLAGAQVRAVSRRGKYLWLPLTGPAARDSCLVAHLGMSGQLLVQPTDAPDQKHLHVRVRFADGGPELRFVDQRTFGGVFLDELVPAVDRPEEALPASVAHIARDPLDPVFDDDAFVRALRRRSSALKRALLDQTLVSGIGNIYADESLWRARLHPLTPAAALDPDEVKALHRGVRQALRAGISRQGSTLRDYRLPNGEQGGAQHEFKVYGRGGEPCERCGTPIDKIRVAGRGTWYCPSCQRVKTGYATRRSSSRPSRSRRQSSV
jgi:formamidopyrimidine-DNA glycosylase